MSPSPILENLLYEKRSAIAYVTLNRPKVLNALNQATWNDLRTAFEDARDDAEIRGVILTGAGDKAFIAGADIGELARLSPIDGREHSRRGQMLLDRIEQLHAGAVREVVIREDQVKRLQVLFQRGGTRAHTGDGAAAEMVFQRFEDQIALIIVVFDDKDFQSNHACRLPCRL